MINMNRKIKAFDIWAHSVLIVGISVGIAGYLRVRFDPIKGFLAVAFCALYYVIWGFVYHNLKGDFNRKLMFEYLIIAGIALLAGFLVLIA